MQPKYLFRAPDLSGLRCTRSEAASELQQEESQSDDTEEHKHVDEEQHPAAAVQPAGQRSPARRAEAACRTEAGRGVSNLPDLPARRKRAASVLAPFVFVGLLLGQRGRALVPLPHTKWR